MWVRLVAPKADSLCHVKRGDGKPESEQFDLFIRFRISA